MGKATPKNYVSLSSEASPFSLLLNKIPEPARSPRIKLTAPALITVYSGDLEGIFRSVTPKSTKPRINRKGHRPLISLPFPRRPAGVIRVSTQAVAFWPFVQLPYLFFLRQCCFFSFIPLHAFLLLDYLDPP